MAGEAIVELTDANFQAEVLESPQPVLVDFWAPWCGPCRMLTPTVEALAEKWAGQAKVGKLNVDDNQQIALKYRVEGIPTLILFQGGEPVQTMVGVRPQEELDQAIAQTLPAE
jgi:thioredoxin 1